MKENIILRGGRVIDPQTGVDEVADIRIEGGVIKELGKVSEERTEALDLTGKIVLPGLFDMHVHLREPGREDTETIHSGCAAAAAGGFTGIACMPDTDPPADTSGIVEFILRKSSGLPVSVHPIAAVSRGRGGEKLSEMYDLLNAGAVAFSDDPSPLVDTDLLRRALEYASDLGAVIIQHAEDPYLFEGVMHEGLISTRLGLAGIPSLCEENTVIRDIRMTEYVNARLHFAHISTKESLEHILAAKARGVKVTAEVTPHHLFLTDEAVLGFDTYTKVNPPLRDEAHREALISGLLEGTIDAIASDHYPHAIEEKENDFNSAPFGIIGLETSLGLALTELVNTGRMDWNMLALRMSISPRRILNLSEVKIEIGAKANLTIIDPDYEWEVNPDNFKSLSRNTPFGGRKLKGRAWGIYNNGQLVLNE